jgi:hypothetical protein
MVLYISAYTCTSASVIDGHVRLVLLSKYIFGFYDVRNICRDRQLVFASRNRVMSRHRYKTI